MQADRVTARWIALALIAVLPVLMAATMSWTCLRAAAAVRAPGPADPVDALVALAAGACAVLLAWLAGSVLVVITVTAASSRGRLCCTARRMQSVLAPVAVQRLVAALVGAGVVTGLATPAMARDAVPQAPAPHVTASVTTDRDPQDRTPAGTTAPPTMRTETGRVQTTLDPGWVPLPPAGPDTRTRASSTPTAPSVPGSATLLTVSPRAGSQPVHEVVVRRGDTLWDLAARHLGGDATDAEIATEWPRWYAANRALVGSDPDHILPGQRLAPPAPTNL